MSEWGLEHLNRINKQRELIVFNRQGTEQQTWIAYGNSTWHTNKYKVHKLHQRYILKKEDVPWGGVYVYLLAYQVELL